MSNRVAAGIAAGTTAPTAETVVASILPGAVNPAATTVEVRADLVIDGATSTTGVTLRLRRGTTTAGTVIATAALTISATGIRGESLGFLDAAPDGTGYCLTVQAVGAAGTCGPGVLAAQTTTVKF